MIELHLRGRAAPDRDQQRVEHDPQTREDLRRWRALLASAPEVVTYRVDTPA